MGLSHGPPETTIKQWMDWRFHRHHPISPQADGLRSSHKIHGFFPSIPTVHGKKQVQNPRKISENPQDSLHFFQPKQKESVRLQAVALELQGADNDVEAITGSAGRRVPRVVEAPQEALQLQRQDAMRDAEKMATQAGYGGMGGFRLFFDLFFVKNDEKWWTSDTGIFHQKFIQSFWRGDSASLTLSGVDGRRLICKDLAESCQHRSKWLGKYYRDSKALTIVITQRHEQEKPLRAVTNHCLVGGLEDFLFLRILGISSSQLTKSYFSEG